MKKTTQKKVTNVLLYATLYALCATQVQAETKNSDLTYWTREKKCCSNLKTKKNCKPSSCIQDCDKQCPDSVNDLVKISDLTTIVPPEIFTTDTSFLLPFEQILGGTLFRNCEEEVSLAVNPLDTDNMVAFFHQDRWSSGACLGLGMRFTTDGGKTWQVPANPIKTTFYEGADRQTPRSSDPWVSFSPNGTCHAEWLPVLDNLESILLSARSFDGGNSWTEPVVVTLDTPGNFVGNDKETITADPQNSNLVYSTWQFFPIEADRIQLKFARSIDGGASWEPVQTLLETIWEPPTDVSFLGAIIEVLADGTLLLVSSSFVCDLSTGFGLSAEMFALRSFDKGTTWQTTPIKIADIFLAPGQDNGNQPIDVELGISVRAGLTAPAIASNPSTGQVYVVFQDKRFNPNGLCGSVIVTSNDDGLTWTNPVPVNPNTLNVQTFLPQVSVLPDGRVAVLYYDFRNAIGGTVELETDVWVNIFDANLEYLLQEIRVTADSFDLRQFDIAGGYFPGDYTSIKTTGNDLVAAFPISNPLGCFPPVIPTGELTIDPKNRQNIVFARIKPDTCKKQCPVSLCKFRSVTGTLASTEETRSRVTEKTTVKKMTKEEQRKQRLNRL